MLDAGFWILDTRCLPEDGRRLTVLRRKVKGATHNGMDTILFLIFLT
jgi:hypothetical protein